MMWSGCDGFGVMWGFGMLHILLIWLMVIGVFIWLMRMIRFHPHHGFGMPPPPDAALDLLKKRYAAGEINREEFEQKRKDIER